MASTEKNVAIGIDLGTTNCCAAIVRNGTVEVIKSERDQQTTPSYVLFGGALPVVGKTAEDNVHVYPDKVIYDSKRCIGRRFNDENIQKNLKYWKFNVEADVNGSPEIRIPQRSGQRVTVTPEYVSTLLLKEMKKLAEENLSKEVTHAVITVPAYFNYHQRSATQRAGQEAGFEVMHILDEPLAAAIAYISNKKLTEDTTVLVYDLGGGTFDVSIIKIDMENGQRTFTVLAKSGNTYLGGRDFDNNLNTFITNQLISKGIRVTKPVARRIANQSQNIKIQLSLAPSALFRLDFDEENEEEIIIQRSDFEKINIDLFEKTISIVEDCMKTAKLAKEQIDEVFLVGGSSKIPKIQELLLEMFGKGRLSKSVGGSEVVAHGAAIKAANGDGCGAVRVRNVTPLSLGVSVLGQRMSVIIPRNTSIPISKRSTFMAAVDNQTTMEFNVYEGERSLIKDNTFVGSFKVQFKPKPVGRPVTVIFSLDENGILDASAEVDSELYKHIAITYNAQSAAAVEAAIEAAEKYKTQDKADEKKVEKYSHLYSCCQRILSLCRNSNEIAASDKSTLNQVCTDIYNWLLQIENNCIGKEEEVDTKLDDLVQVCYPVLEKYGLDFVIAMSDTEFYNYITSA